MYPIYAVARDGGLAPPNARVCKASGLACVLPCIAGRRPIKPGEPMVIVITALPARLSRIPLQRNVDAGPGPLALALRPREACL